MSKYSKRHFGYKIKSGLSGQRPVRFGNCPASVRKHEDGAFYRAFAAMWLHSRVYRVHVHYMHYENVCYVHDNGYIVYNKTGKNIDFAAAGLYSTGDRKWE